MQTPVVSGFMESFASGSLINSTTECPTGYTMYMYDGAAYCCKGTVNTDAPNLKRSCIAISTQEHALCTLGSSNNVKNCTEIRKSILQTEGKNTCPPSMPNFCTSTTSRRCCSSAVNETGTDCIHQEGSCTFGSGKNEFLDPTDCRLLRQKEMDATCPIGFHQILSSISNPQSPLNGLSLYSCTDLNNNCYTENLVQRLRTLGYDVSQLRTC
jgi:hypothetical protein